MLVLPERERTKKGAIGVETKGVTCKIPLDLHNQISEEIRETESTMSKFIEMVIREHYEKGANRIMEKGRTLAFQVSEELFQRVKEYLENYEKNYHRRLTQKEFVISLIEQALEVVYAPEEGGEDPELEAAAGLVEGRYRKKLEAGRRDLVVAALMRRGFAYAVIKEAIKKVEEE